MKRYLLPLLSLLALIASLTACGGSSGSKIEESIDKSYRDYETDEVRSAINELIKTDKELGVSVALIADNRVVFAEGFGLSNIETGESVTADTSFWLGSVSKPVVGVALMQAQEQGLLSLADHVQTLLANDDQVELSLPHTYPLLLAHLVNHTGGISDPASYACAYFVGDEFAERYSLANSLNDLDCDEAVPVDLAGYLNAYLSETGIYYSAEDNFLDVEPGTTFEYSNIGTALAGYLLESQSGRTLADFAQAHIFDTLAMDNTSWKLSALDRANLATPHVWNGQSMNPLPIYSLATWPAGGLRGSANDMAKFLLAIANGGELPADSSIGSSKPTAVRILEEDSVDTLLTPQVSTVDGYDIGVLWVTLQLPTGRVLVGHDGSGPGAYSYLFFDPENNVGIVMIGNGNGNGIEEYSTDFNERHYELIDRLLGHAETLGDL